MLHIERLGAETEAEHPADQAGRLLAIATAADYRRYLARCFGFVLPVERAITSTRDVARFIDTRRFTKHELLRRDLRACHLSSEGVERLPLCTVPVFGSPAEALGWAYVLERSTLDHGTMFRHLATKMPGDIAFSSSYLKCYFGVVGESWAAFGEAVEAASKTQGALKRMTDAANAGFRTHRAWQRAHDESHFTSNGGHDGQRRA